jgi:hypothetical protein
MNNGFSNISAWSGDRQELFILVLLGSLKHTFGNFAHNLSILVVLATCSTVRSKLSFVVGLRLCLVRFLVVRLARKRRMQPVLSNETRVVDKTTWLRDANQSLHMTERHTQTL